MGFSPADSEALLSLSIGLSVANRELVRILPSRLGPHHLPL